MEFELIVDTSSKNYGISIANALLSLATTTSLQINNQSEMAFAISAGGKHCKFSKNLMLNE